MGLDASMVDEGVSGSFLVSSVCYSYVEGRGGAGVHFEGHVPCQGRLRPSGPHAVLLLL